LHSHAVSGKLWLTLAFGEIENMKLIPTSKRGWTRFAFICLESSIVGLALLLYGLTGGHGQPLVHYGPPLHFIFWLLVILLSRWSFSLYRTQLDIGIIAILTAGGIWISLLFSLFAPVIVE
jgi:hypothetical protein